MATLGDINMKINIKISLFMALKIRISGMFNNLKKIEQVGDILTIEYKD